MHDPRNIRNGLVIPTETYSDQPYVVHTGDGAWLCVVTTGVGHEGQSGQHVVTLRSADQGKTWSTPVDVEPADGPEASYAVLLKAPPGTPQAGRIFCFYNHNTDNVREVIADPSWSPDGSKIVFQTDRDGDWEIYSNSLWSEVTGGVSIGTTMLSSKLGVHNLSELIRAAVKQRLVFLDE